METSVKRARAPVWKWIWLPFLIGAVFWSGYFFFRPIQTVGSSNTPTFHDSELLWLRAGSAVQRGDFVEFTADKRFPGAQYLKRVVGMPGERIRMLQGQVFINGQPLREAYAVPYWKAQNNFDTCSYLANSDYWSFRPRTYGSPCTAASKIPQLEDVLLQADEYFVLGDNRSPGGSEDSTSLGPIRRERMTHILVAVGFPPRPFERP